MVEERSSRAPQSLNLKGLPEPNIRQRHLRISPVRALSLKLGLDTSLTFICLLEGRLVTIHLVSQLLNHTAALPGQLAALVLLDA